MPAFSISPVGDFPAATDDGFPKYVQIRSDGVNLGGPDAEIYDFLNGVATRGTGENANVITIDSSKNGGGAATGFSWNEQTVDYTLVAADLGNGLAMNSATPTTVTVPAFADVPTVPGDAILVYQQGAGVSTIVGATGVTLVADGDPTTIETNGQGALVTLVNRDTNVWVVGDDYAQPMKWRSVTGDYTLVLADGNNAIAMDGSTLTIPAHADVPFRDGTSILLRDVAYGNPVTVVGAGGVTVAVRSALLPTTAGQDALVSIIQNGIDSWYLAGDLAYA